VRRYDDAGIHGFLLSDRAFTTIDFPGAVSTELTGISPQGDIVGRYVTAGAGHRFLLSGSTFTTIDFPGATSSNALSINPRGDIVGVYVGAGSATAFC
jgi:hypothetical protein